MHTFSACVRDLKSTETWQWDSLENSSIKQKNYKQINIKHLYFCQGRSWSLDIYLLIVQKKHRKGLHFSRTGHLTVLLLTAPESSIISVIFSPELDSTEALLHLHLSASKTSSKLKVNLANTNPLDTVKPSQRLQSFPPVTVLYVFHTWIHSELLASSMALAYKAAV